MLYLERLYIVLMSHYYIYIVQSRRLPNASASGSAGHFMVVKSQGEFKLTTNYLY